MRKVDPSTIQTLSERIQQLPAVEQPRPMSEALATLAPLISDACARGQDLESILQLLEQHGINVKRSTLETYLRRASKARPRSNPTPASSRELTKAVRLATVPRSVPTKTFERERENATPRPRGTFEVVPDSVEI